VIYQQGEKEATIAAEQAVGLATNSEFAMEYSTVTSSGRTIEWVKRIS
jgi:hypothetical protein